MKKAFTLIELLVVIAIIAILAAILFPVFAQAKSAAKKTAAISNQKQIGASILMYMADSDDTYPRNDDCILNSALNPRLNGAAAGTNPASGCTGPFQWRMNHYTWQKWLQPYSKNVDIFAHPGRQRRDDTNNGTGFRQWSQNGQIMGGFALNLALTGAINTWNRADNAAGRLRNSWLGGTQTAIPNPSQAMLLMEFGHPDVNFSPVVFENAQNNNVEQTVYPAAFREFWGRVFNQWTTCSGANMNEISQNADPRSTFANVIVVGFADGSAKALPVNRFLAQTPLASEYAALPSTNACGATSGTIRTSNVPNTNINYPMWGLGGG
ncbi:MAG TPA: prepilin-type N-terminal cleavage/methylation domain-containing protein [Fimbriimonadaceae bacterium]|nr:prepilin-type N-terminal cleavage/methylation domain-containing protein [Fimbriimonadaceae bacterium]